MATLQGNDQPNRIDGTNENDTIIGRGGDDTLDGAGGNDFVTGNDGRDDVRGGDGDDTLIGGAGVDTLTGGAGRDLFRAEVGQQGDVVTDFGTDDAFRTLGRTFGQDNILATAQGGDTLLEIDTDRNGSGETSFVLRGRYDAANLVVLPSLVYQDFDDDEFDGYDINGTLIVLTDADGGSEGRTSGRGVAGDLTFGTNGADTLTEGGGDDTLAGRDGNDVLSGGGGFDLVDGGRGNDDLRGGTGNDVLLGGLGADRIRGEDGNDFALGGDGNDTLEGGNGRDDLDGGAGADTITGGEGNDALSGGAGNDTVRGGDDADAIAGGAGRDLLDGGEDADRVGGGDGDDTIFGGGGEDVLLGDGGNDVLYGFQQGNASEGGVNKNDTLIGGDGNDRAFGGAGNDLIEGGTGNDSLFGQADNDTIFGGTGGDLIEGGDGFDLLFGGQGADRIDGGGGLDVASYAGATSGIVLDLRDGARNAGDAAGDVVTNVEAVVGSRYADRLVGTAGSDVLNGGDALSLDRFDDSGRNVDSVNGSIFRLYQAVFDRDPDEGGFAFQTDALRGGTTIEAIASNFVDAPEFEAVYGDLNDRDFIQLLYQNVLGREGEASGVQFYLDAFNNGATRGDVVVGFANSPEFQFRTQVESDAYATSEFLEDAAGKIFRLYDAAFDRIPDAGGFDFNIQALDDGLTVGDLVPNFFNSPEFQNTYGQLSDDAFIELLYENVLGREPDAGGRQFYRDALASGVSRVDVLLGFSESPENQSLQAPELARFLDGQLDRYADTLEGGAGDDQLIGGLGADTFVFRASDDGTDQVFAFEAVDNLVFAGFGYGDAGDALDQMSQIGGDVVFDDEGVIVFFEDTTLAEVAAADITVS